MYRDRYRPDGPGGNSANIDTNWAPIELVAIVDERPKDRLVGLVGDTQHWITQYRAREKRDLLGRPVRPATDLERFLALTLMTGFSPISQLNA
jgi:hypothetical protein